jgi:anti-sigma factor RsiW
MIRAWRCRRLEAALVDYSEGMLAGAERERVERHAAGCARCAAALAALVDVPALFEPAAALRSDAFWVGQRQRVMRAIREPVAPAEELQPRGFDWRLAMPVAVALVVALAGYLSLRPPSVPGEAVLDALSPEDLAALTEVSGGIVAAPDLVPEVAADPSEALEGAVEAGWIRIEPPPAWADLDDEDLDELRGITG